MPPEDDPSASGSDGQSPDRPADPQGGSAGSGESAWIPGQERAGEPPAAVLPGQRTAHHRRSPFPGPRADEPGADRPAGAEPPGAGAPDTAAPGAVAAPLRPDGDAPEHASAAPADDGPSDAYLADRVREGDDAAYEVLYQRHVDAVRRLARLCTRTRENADDLVAETFTRTLRALRSGHGPREACRPYLLTTTRHVAGDWTRNERRVLLTDDVASYEPRPGGEPDDPAVAADDRRMAAQAFKELPERWQAVLWYTEVEREPRERVAPRLGVSPNALSKLKERARDGLRDAYLKVYVENGLAEECRPYAEHYGAYVRQRLGVRAEENVRTHLDGCDRCRAACLELAGVSTHMRVVAEGLLGAVALTYIGAASATTAVGVLAGGATGAAGSGAGSSGSGSSGGGGAQGAAGKSRTAVRASAVAGVLVVALAALAWAFMAQQPQKDGEPAPPPAAAPAPAPPPPPAPEPPPPPPPAAPPPPPAPTPPPPPPPKPAPPTPTPPKPTPTPPKPSPSPPATTKPRTPPPTTRAPRPPKPSTRPTIIVEPTRVVVDNGQARVECTGKQAGNSGRPRCDQVKITVPNSAAGPNGRGVPLPACDAPGHLKNSRVTICRG
ncbi:sigma-70 family RNA polymerase sigma factor [Yinghuangia sp. ASG 101]|uniref:sigma-70 family RNA polymerase sigma factor n=1 Tax=Yinghuangia sp. ASG 101 TaxID=2896848 RepID=UPI001E64DEBE|nr:sigma-70 family RNA polymerase sigma factor [Yinghuangia sp. ASG 101]UGQ10706.1 sigma-70 family RNA polymerase sigma factor [Yinghuangia sp. ASG 101]